MQPRPPATGTSCRQTTSEIDDGWVLPDESARARPLLVTDDRPEPGPAPDVADGWPLQVAPMSDRLDLNAATAGDLVALPGVGACKAKVIVDRRTERGPFGSVAELAELRGFGPKLVAALADHVRV